MPKPIRAIQSCPIMFLHAEDLLEMHPDLPRKRRETDGPPSIGGRIGQSRTLMLLVRKAHLREVSVTVWPKILQEMCAERDIHVLE